MSDDTKKADSLQIIPLLLTAFITPFMGSALNMSVPSISEEFSAGAVSMGWIVTSYLLSSTALLVPFGRIADIYGKKKVFVTGIVLVAVFSVLCAFSNSIGLLILFRLGQGIGAGMLFATNTAIVASEFPVSMRGRMMGISVMFTYLGLSAGPVAGGLLNRHMGWRSIFLFTAIYCIVSLITSVTMLKDDSRNVITGQAGRDRHESAVKKLDAGGCILYTAASAAFLYGLTDFMTSLTARIIFFISLVLAGVFVWAEKKTDNPVLDITMFTGSRTFTMSNIAALLNYGASFSISYLMSIYLQNVRGMSSDAAGLVLITAPLLQVIFSPLAGSLSDRHAPALLASAGMSLTCAGIVMLIFVRNSTSMLYIIAALAVVGSGFGFFSSPNTNAIMSSADRDKYGVASSIMSASRTIGQTASMSVVTAVFAIVIGNVELSSTAPGSLVSALSVEFIVSAVLCGLGIFCSARR